MNPFLPAILNLGKHLVRSPLPPEIVKATISANPWFTPYYIETAWKNILSWWENHEWEILLANHIPVKSPQKVGIIAAGNIPMVGLHDVLMSVVSGNTTYLKTSHADAVLIPYIIAEWKKISPEIADSIFCVSTLPATDFLLATGSNSTARHLQYQYVGTQHFIRGNRYSVAVLEGNESEKELQNLCEDVFLYNGMGCRNVSNILTSQSKIIEKLIRFLQAYPQEKLSFPYREKIRYDRAAFSLYSPQKIQDFGTIFIEYTDTIRPAAVGILQVCLVDKEAEKRILADAKRHLQCVAGKSVAFGKTQIPALTDFADGVDTLNLLSYL